MKIGGAAFAQGWVAAPNMALADPSLSHLEKTLIGLLLDLSREVRWCFASYAYLGRRLGCHPKSVARAIRTIRAKHAAGETQWNICRQLRQGKSNLIRVVAPTGESQLRIAKESRDRRAIRHQAERAKADAPKSIDAPLFAPPASTLAPMRIAPASLHNRPARQRQSLSHSLPAALPVGLIRNEIPIDYSSQPRSKPRPPDPMRGTLFEKRPRFNLLAESAGTDPVLRLIRAVTSDEVTGVMIAGRARVLLAVKAGHTHAFLHLAVEGTMNCTECVRVPLHQLGGLELLA